MNSEERTFETALTSYVSKLNNGRVRHVDEENRIGLYEYIEKLIWRPNYIQKQYIVCAATQAVGVNLEKHIYTCKSFTNYDDACKYYLEACEETARIWGRDKASA